MTNASPPPPANQDPLFNPYEAPKSTKVTGDSWEGSMWSDGPLLVVRKGALFSDRCLRCNAPAEGYRLKKTLSWHHPAVYLALLANLLIYAVLAICLRKRARLELPVCPRHRARRSLGIALGWTLSLLAIVTMVAAPLAGLTDPYLGPTILGSVALLLAAVIGGIIMSEIVAPARIDDHFAWLKKVTPEFLADLSDWPGPR